MRLFSLCVWAAPILIVSRLPKMTEAGFIDP